MEEVVEFAGELDAGWAAAYYDDVEETFDLFFGLAGERSGLEAVHESPLHILSILQLLHEYRVLLHTGNTKGLRLGADSVDEVVVPDGCGGCEAFHVGCVRERHGLIHRVNRLRLRLNNGHTPRLEARDVPDRLQYRPYPQCPHSSGGQKRREEEVVPRAHYHDVIILRIYILQQTRRSPPSPQDNNRLLLLIKRQLRTRHTFAVDVEHDGGCTADDSEEGRVAYPADESRPSSGFWWWGWGRWRGCGCCWWYGCVSANS